MFTLKIDTENAAFDDGQTDEIARILRKIADEVEHGGYYPGQSQTVRDINGNDVGRYKLDPSEFEIRKQAERRRNARQARK